MSWAFTASTGQGFTHESIVDAHFHACRDAYLDSLQRVGIQPGWRVLDAGCGSGSFLPTCAALARQAAELGTDSEEWAAFRDPDDPANPLNHPAAYVAEGLTLAVGTRAP